jgi:TPR repeat protein
VAVKIFPLLHLDPEGPPSRREPVIQEARALCRVENPHIVRFHTIYVDEGKGLLGLVMEYLDGPSLERRLQQRGPMPVAEVIELGVQLASALASVHSVGLVHRDVKPANVIDARGQYKLIDFGIATLEPPAAVAPRRRVMLDDLPFEIAGSRMSGLTEAQTMQGGTEGTGRFLQGGTVGYMDPVSVATGAPATAASDLYGLGVVLFEALTGHLPARGPAGLRGEILDGRSPAPPLASFVAAPEPLCKLIDALLAPERGGRPGSATEVESMLLALQKPTPQQLKAAVGEPLPLTARLAHGSWRWMLGAIALTAGWAFWRGSPTPPCSPGATAVCQQRCERGEGASCHTLGLMFERASGVPKDELKAAELFERACSLDHGAACCALGLMREQGRGGKLDEAEARQRYERACTLGDPQGCNGLAIQLAKGAGGPQDKARAVLLYQRACDAGYANGCANLGALHERGDGVPRDEARARSLYERACNEGAPSSCGLLALALLAGRGGPTDLPRSTALFERACGGGHAFACVGLGVLLEQGTNERPPERERAASLYHQACEDGERQGCLHLGQLHQRGEGVPLDEQKAAMLFQRACEQGHPLGCRLAGEASATGRGVLKDDTRAAGFFRKACKPDDGVADAEGCAWLSLHLRHGRGVERSLEEAEQLRNKACELGASLGCPPAPLPGRE